MKLQTISSSMQLHFKQGNFMHVSSWKCWVLAVSTVSLIGSGCSTASKDIAATYTSPVLYQNYDCDQLSMEAQRVHSRVNQLGGRLDEAAENDKALVGVGMILFWPALFALGGTKEQEAEYAKLKGEYEAISQASTIKKCGLTEIAINQ